MKTGRNLESADGWIVGIAALWRVCWAVFEVNVVLWKGYEVLLVEEIRPIQGHYLPNKR